MKSIDQSLRRSVQTSLSRQSNCQIKVRVVCLDNLLFPITIPHDRFLFKTKNKGFFEIK